ncbi:MAG: cyclic pyranopterin monophosphate synthase MoaC [Clostridia bacterium]|nr:cyclic pyranopterin monophosphate synthase MoaC [Clostridia bacterium]
MKKVPIVSIVAACSGMGKTTFLEKLIKEMVSRGIKVGTIKNDAHGFELDKPGKDSWRHAQAGAKATAIIGPDKYALIQTMAERADLEKVAAMLEDVDIILVEGNKKGTQPKIEVIRAEKGREVTVPEKDLVAVVTDIKDLAVDVPCFDINDYQGVADIIQEKFLLSVPEDKVGELSHFDKNGQVRIVDVTEKAETTREAVSMGEIWMASETFRLVAEGKMAKGDVLAVARIAGIMGVKETSRLIPMCHPLNIGAVHIDFKLDEKDSKVEIECRVKIKGQTGVEMEALTGVNIAALTIYDMCKAIDKNMVISNIRLIKKTGGKSGTYLREE